MQVFAEPDRLLLLLAAPVAAVAVAWGRRRRWASWRALGLPGGPPPDGAWAWWWAGVCLVLALAGPRWGRVPGSELPPGHDVVLLVDVSRSMAAEDAAPDRLGLARAAARGLVEQLRREPGDRAALVAFAGRAAARCPLTDNLDAVLDALKDLRPGMIEPGGTDLGAGLAASLDAFDSAEHAEGRSIVVLSDGEDHAESWPAMVERLVAAGVVAHVVAIGDPDGAHPVPAGGRAARGASAPLTRRTDAALAQVARATGGAVVPLGVAAGDLGALFRDRLAPTARASRPAPRFSERAERYGIGVSTALVLATAGAWPSARRLRQARWGRHPGFARPARPWGRVAAAVAIALLILAATLAADPTPPARGAEAANARGIAAYRAGDFNAAVAAFDEATAARPGSPIGPANAASALYALGRYPEAVARYAAARVRADEAGAARVDYGLGNATAMLGDLAGAVRHYDACLASAATGPGLDEVRRDAATNRAFLLARLAPPPAAPEEPDGGSGREQGPGEGRGRPPRRPGGGPDDGGPAGGDDGAGSAGGDGPPRRGLGGAGGGGAAPAPADSPEGRLDAALRRIRGAKEQQPAASPPPDPAPGGRGSDKDW